MWDGAGIRFRELGGKVSPDGSYPSVPPDELWFRMIRELVGNGRPDLGGECGHLHPAGTPPQLCQPVIVNRDMDPVVVEVGQDGGDRLLVEGGVTAVVTELTILFRISGRGPDQG